MYLYYIENLLLICVRFNTETSFAWGARLAPLAIVRPCLLPPPFCFYPMWVLFAPFCGLFSAFCCPLWVVYFSWVVRIYVDVSICVLVPWCFSLDLCGSLVHDELFNSRGGSVGSGDSSQFEIFLVTPLEIWG
jgi:hypothetical protein